MDLLEYAAQELKKGKKPAEIRNLLVENGYPVYEIENALALTDSKDGKKQRFSVKAPGYVVILIISGILIVIGIITLILYFAN